jgi:hypothetical protein
MDLRTLPKEGDRITVSKLTGYKLVQNRPMECRTWRPSSLPENKGKYTSSCEGACGGNCNGVTTYHEGTVEKVIFWADNSIEAQVRLDDGTIHTKQYVAPHGDVC